MTRLLALVSALLLVGCPGDSGTTAPGPGTVVELPPPLVGSTRSASLLTADVVPDDDVLPDPAQDAAGPAWLRIFVSQDNRAELDPCGCPGSPSGGMGKRAHLTEELRRTLAAPLVLEGPTSLSRAVLGTEDVGGKERTRARAVLDALAVSRPDAFFVGQADLEVLAPRELAARASALDIPLVASNMVPQLPGFQDRLVVERRGRRALFLGLVGAARNAGQAAAVPLGDAASSAARIIAEEESRGGLDLVVVVTDAEKRELVGWHEAGLDAELWFVPPGLRREGKFTREDDRVVVRADSLGRSFRRVDVAFSGPRGRAIVPTDEFPLIEAAKAERQHVLQGLETARLGEEDPDRRSELKRGRSEAKYRRGLALQRAAESTPGHRIAVTDLLIHPDLTAHPDVAEILAAYNEERIGALVAVASESPEAPRGRRFQGLDACTECHAAEVAQWGRSPHAKAWRTLVDAGQTRNPDCLTCHTTGFGDPGGWVDPDLGRHLFNVQCESCHGPMDLHVDQAKSRQVKPDPGISVTETLCVTCHDAANSPDFEFDHYARRVAHTPPRDEP